MNAEFVENRMKELETEFNDVVSRIQQVKKDLQQLEYQQLLIKGAYDECTKVYKYVLSESSEDISD